MSLVGLDNYVWLFTNPALLERAAATTFTIGVLSTVPQLLIALGLAHLLNYRLRGRDVLPRRDADARTRRRWRPPRWCSCCSSAGTAGMINWVLGTRRDRPRRLAQRQLDRADRHLHDRHLALDRLQRADLPGRACRRSRRPVRGRGARRGLAVAAVPPRDDARRCGRRSCSRSSSRRSARSQLFGEPLLFAAARPRPAALGTSTRRSACTCTSRAGRSGTWAGPRPSPGRCS